MVGQKVMVVAIDKEEFVALDIKIVGENFLELPQELEWKRGRGLFDQLATEMMDVKEEWVLKKVTEF